MFRVNKLPHHVQAMDQMNMVEFGQPSPLPISKVFVFWKVHMFLRVLAHLSYFRFCEQED